MNAILDARFARLLDELEPYVVVHAEGLGELDLAPFGIAVEPHRRFDPLRVAHAPVVDGLARLDAATFGQGDGVLAMPRWVLFDCGTMPGLVFGLGARAATLPDAVRAHYRVEDEPEAFVPLSMWIAIRALRPGAWFGHNLASANTLAERPRWPGLGLLTKALGLRVARATEQLGATQWASPSLGVHLRLGPLELLAADTPAHTLRETLVYRLVPHEAALRRALAGEAQEDRPWDLELDRGDVAALRRVHSELEAGAAWTLVGLAGRGAVRLARGAPPGGSTLAPGAPPT